MYGGGAIAQAGADTFATGMTAVQNRLQESMIREHAKYGHVWEVEGLKKAGLNPVLSAQGPVHIPSPSPAAIPSPAKSIGADINSAITAGQKQEELELQRRRTDQENQKQYVDTIANSMESVSRQHLMSAQAENLNSQSLVNLQQVPKMQEEMKMIIENQHLSTAQQKVALEDAFRKMTENVPARKNQKAVGWADYIKSWLPNTSIVPFVGPKIGGKK